jgi:RNA polymerase primary sigma factor
MILPIETSTIPPDSMPERNPSNPRRGGLSRDEERRLAARIAAGDREARNQLVQANLGLVVRIARQYVGRGLMIEDLVGEGNLGLIRAAEEFEPRFGTRFSTYATYWIKDAILSALINTTATIRVPAHMFKLVSRWRRAEQALTRAGGREPGFDEVAAALGLSREQKDLVAKALHAGGLRLESGLASGSSPWPSERALAQHEPPEALLEADEERDFVRRGLERLDSRERTILTWRYGLSGELPIPLKEIGIRLGMTKEWVRKVATHALRKLVAGREPCPEAIAEVRARHPRCAVAATLRPAPPAPPAASGAGLPCEPSFSLPQEPNGSSPQATALAAEHGYLARCG